MATDLQTRNATRMDHGSADGAFWYLAASGIRDSGRVLVVAGALSGCGVRKVLGMRAGCYKGLCDPWFVSRLKFGTAFRLRDPSSLQVCNGDLQ